MKVINVRVSNLRKLNYHNLVEWKKDPKHLYIGRTVVYVEGAIKSKWANPFSVKKYGREMALEKYKQYVRASNLYNQLDELEEMEELGCWCKPETCHGDILIELINERKLSTF